MTKPKNGSTDTTSKIGISNPAYQRERPNGREPDGDTGLKIARDGTWSYQGSPITRKPLVKLFSTVLQRDQAGDYWLVTPVERARIAVEDAPFTAVELAARGSGPQQVLAFRNNVDDWVEAGPDHPIRVSEDPATGEPRPYILVRDNLEALILRSVYYEMVELADIRKVEDIEWLGLWSHGAFFPLGRPA